MSQLIKDRIVQLAYSFCSRQLLAHYHHASTLQHCLSVVAGIRCLSWSIQNLLGVSMCFAQYPVKLLTFPQELFNSY